MKRLFSALLLFSVLACRAQAADPAVNLSEIPTISLEQAMARAKEELPDHGLVCTLACSQRQMYGGGWFLDFRNDQERIVLRVTTTKTLRKSKGKNRGYAVPAIVLTDATKALASKTLSPVIHSMWDGVAERWELTVCTRGHAEHFTYDAKNGVQTFKPAPGHFPDKISDELKNPTPLKK